MKWLLAGASGFLGQALRVRLASRATRWSGSSAASRPRRRSSAGTLTGAQIDPAALDGVEAVVNLGGVGRRSTGPWTEPRREGILSSRVRTTQTLAERDRRTARGPTPGADPGERDRPVRHVANAEPLTEDAPGRGRLPRPGHRPVGGRGPAGDARPGSRTVFLRTSPVMDRSGGAFAPMKLAWSAGSRREARRRRAAHADDQPRRLSAASCSGPPTRRTPPGRTT